MYEVLNRTTTGRMNRNNFLDVNARNPYPTRRGTDLYIPMCHTKLCKGSFRLAGNSLTDDIRSSTSKNAFKVKVRAKPNPDSYYNLEAERIAGINHTRLRTGNCNLNENLYARNLVDSPECSCGHQTESVNHYLLDCPNYLRARTDAKCHVPGAWNGKDLIVGSKIRYTPEENIAISRTVQMYISTTGRFD